MAEQPARAKAPRPLEGEGSLRVGRLTKPHGLKGGLKVELYTDNPDARFEPGAVFHLQVPEDSSWFGRTISVRELRWFNGVPGALVYESGALVTALSVAIDAGAIHRIYALRNPDKLAAFPNALPE